MKALIFSESEAQKFPILNLSGGIWQALNNTVSGVYWLQLDAEQDLIDNGVEYTTSEVEIKQENIQP